MTCSVHWLGSAAAWARWLQKAQWALVALDEPLLACQSSSCHTTRWPQEVRRAAMVALVEEQARRAAMEQQQAQLLGEK